MWVCAACHRPWPCPRRRWELLGEYADSPGELALHMAAQLTAASRDLHWAAPAVLCGRFFGWLP
ncbi:hypothetical protein F6X54_33195 [Micromonospora aurantiaca]|uniref:Flavin reductase n=1 Tax=Micromonospora aurantiaca (nom. illeg.) TaxID=47850 RepID=A0ABQ6U775_9ACTN|nr:hypothetical protein F6X54_33195 [Micromonospora aurantiaca]